MVDHVTSATEERRGMRRTMERADRGNELDGAHVMRRPPGPLKRPLAHRPRMLMKMVMYLRLKVIRPSRDVPACSRVLKWRNVLL